MKVGTDGVLLGAWVDTTNARSALDIGTGTGLIALMLAQRNPLLQINAIDTDINAVLQATDNINRSPFPERISCRQISLQEYAANFAHTYDLIVSNPPFYRNSLKSPDRKRTQARHTDSLTPEELITLSSHMLSPTGRLSLIYPAEYKEELISIGLTNKLSASRITNVYPTPSTSLAKRVLIELSILDTPFQETNLIIENQRHTYSDDFAQLVRDFYLKM